MKKSFRILSLVLTLAVMLSAFGGTFAYATSEQSTITFSNILNEVNFEDLTTIEVNQMPVYGVTISNPDATLTAVSSDDSVLEIELQEMGNGEYLFAPSALKTGEASLTFTTSDGATYTKSLTVTGETTPTYTLKSDTNTDFSLVRGNSYFLKIQYTSSKAFDIPLVASVDNNVVQAVLVDSDESGNYLYRIDAIGEVGESASILAGGYGYIPQELFKITITQNKNLKVDTFGEYSCNPGDTYRFVAYTNSTTPPSAWTNNSLTSVQYLRKVTGGYEYRVKALKEGYSLVNVRVNGETATFPIYVNYVDTAPEVQSDTPNRITLKQGSSYTYKINIMGGGEPKFVGGTAGVISTQIVKKDGTDYYCKVTATGTVKAETSLYLTFPDSGQSEYNVNLGNITITPPDPIVMQSDTTKNFSLVNGTSYTFKISNAKDFCAGSSGSFKVEKVRESGSNAYYKITAEGVPGTQVGFYMTDKNGVSQKVCVVTVAPVVMKSDTNTNFSLKKGSSYMFKITGATSFYAGTSGIFKVEQVSKSGNDTYFRITATGNKGQQAGFYMSYPHQQPQKVCIATIA